ncbi:MAG: protein translocase subunit SecF [Acidimicrobiia bacterium]
MRPDGRRHTLKDLYHEDTYYEFLDRRWRWALISGILILVSVIGFVARDGLNLGLDFTGGTAWQLTASSSKNVSAGAVRDLVEPLGIKDPKIVILGDRGIRVESPQVTRAEEGKITAALAKYGGITVKAISVSEVGPSWGRKVSTQAVLALGLFFIAVALYLSIRFEFKMALAALAAVVHDIAITVGVYAVTGIEVTPATVIAFLTILGFSLYDTVVVFDKIKENTPQLSTVRGLTYTAMANRSLNQVLMRSLNTSFVALLPVASLLVVGVGLEGALALREFGLALFIGLIIGAYSSIFVATPLLVWSKEREPRYRVLAERSSVRSTRDAAAAMTSTVDDETEDTVPVAKPGAKGQAKPGAKGPATPAAKPATPPPATGTGPVIQPRPRQQKSGRKRK